VAESTNNASAEDDWEQSATDDDLIYPEKPQVGIGIILHVAEPFRILALTDKVPRGKIAMGLFPLTIPVPRSSAESLKMEQGTLPSDSSSSSAMASAIRGSARSAPQAEGRQEEASRAGGRQEKGGRQAHGARKARAQARREAKAG
jgi:hypothetical protein